MTNIDQKVLVGTLRMVSASVEIQNIGVRLLKMALEKGKTKNQCSCSSNEVELLESLHNHGIPPRCLVKMIEYNDKGCWISQCQNCKKFRIIHAGEWGK